MTHDDPFIIRENIIRLRALLKTEISHPGHLTVCRILAEFEAIAVRQRGITPSNDQHRREPADPIFDDAIQRNRLDHVSELPPGQRGNL